MENTDDEPTFLRTLVKASRQRTEQVRWTDRDGCARQTALTPVEAARLGGIARRERISPGEVLKRAAHIPVPKATSPVGAIAVSPQPERVAETGARSNQ